MSVFNCEETGEGHSVIVKRLMNVTLNCEETGEGHSVIVKRMVNVQ